jgi:tRNA pseudouridine55 synthase
VIGFLNINKPQGMTSHDCVAKVRKILGTRRVGHSGTLDPMALGVLPIAVNQATRLLPYLPTGKAYRAVIRFGQTTTTDDREGEILSDRPCPSLTLEEVEKHLAKFIGTIEQVPPAFSAIKIGGKKLYELARSGQNIEVPSRTVTIESITILSWQPGDYPELTIEICCGAGTYIRSVARDWGDRLGCGAMLIELERTLSNGFHLNSSISFDRITPLYLIPADEALSHLPRLTLSFEEAKRWQRGQKISLAYPEGVWKVYQGTKFLGIGKIAEETLSPLVVLPD